MASALLVGRSMKNLALLTVSIAFLLPSCVVDPDAEALASADELDRSTADVPDVKPPAPNGTDFRCKLDDKQDCVATCDPTYPVGYTLDALHTGQANAIGTCHRDEQGGPVIACYYTRDEKPTTQRVTVSCTPVAANGPTPIVE